MSNIFKLALGGTAILGVIVLYLVLGRQDRQRVDVQVQQAEFNQAQADFNADFEKHSLNPDKKAIKKYNAQAAAAQSQYSSLKQEQARREGKIQGQMDDFDKAVSDVDRELGQKNGRRK